MNYKHCIIIVKGRCAIGCDIHEFVEHKVNGVWQLVPDYYGPLHYMAQYNNEYKDKHSWSVPRNYSFFGLMAGVRSETFEAIIPPRGIPKDASYGVKEQWNSWVGEGHTPSYYTLTELLEFKTKGSIAIAYLDINEYKNVNIIGYPNEWCNYVPYTGVEISNNEMDKRIKLLAFWDGEEHYTETIWEHPNRLICPRFWDNIIPAMQELDNNSDNVRFVFWFDN